MTEPLNTEYVPALNWVDLWDVFWDIILKSIGHPGNSSSHLSQGPESELLLTMNKPTNQRTIERRSE